jgi:acylphosphatase
MSERNGETGDGRERSSAVVLHAMVRGRVQGVGFREFTLRTARSLGLGGWVRNLTDGRSVEVWAAGDRGVLEQLRQQLEHGPRMARVTAVECDWHESATPPAHFEVRF